MPSPEVIDLTLSDDKIQPDPIRSDQGPPTPTQATNQFRTSSTIPLTSGINRTRRILPVIQGTTVSTTSTGLGYLTSTLWRLASTHPLTMVLSQKSL